MRPDSVNFNRILLRTLTLAFILLLAGRCPAQKNGIRLPFRMANNLIILSASINDSDTLHFILDSGLKNSIICELGAGEILNLQEAREIHVLGLGDSSHAEAIHSGGNLLTLGGMGFPEQDFMVLSRNILQLSNRMGTRIHGMLSMEPFYDYIVEIDYIRRYISISPPESFRYPKPGRYASIPIQMEAGKPFLVINLKTAEGNSYHVKLLLDSGASNALWLDMNSLEDFPIPEKNRHCHLGCGISGDVTGLLGRIKQVEIGPYSLPDVIVSFPDSLDISQQESVQGRNGSLGSEILKRFDVILDFPGRQILLRPNRNFQQKFHYDMSGIEVIAEVPDRPVYLISRVRDGSVAHLAGARPGDRILSINNVPVQRYSLGDIYLNLLGNEGKRITMELLRESEKIRISFQLEEYI